MQLENHHDHSTYVIRSYGAEGVRVNEMLLTQSFIIMSDQLIQHWQPNHFSKLGKSDLDLIAKLDPEIIILGAGKKLTFPDPTLIAPITSKNIGFEVMDSYAACRCYSILASEGRNVAAGIILET